jgi:hypothetical protein
MTHSERYPDFEANNTLSLRHGTYSPRVVGQVAELVRTELLAQRPDLAGPEMATAVGLFCRASAREQIGHLALERASAANAPISPRLLESVSAAARVAKELADSLGLSPRSAAELRAITTSVRLTEALLAQIIPEMPQAIREALDAVGAGESVEMFTHVFVAALRRGGEED